MGIAAACGSCAKVGVIIDCGAGAWILRELSKGVRLRMTGRKKV